METDKRSEYCGMGYGVNRDFSRLVEHSPHPAPLPEGQGVPPKTQLSGRSESPLAYREEVP